MQILPKRNRNPVRPILPLLDFCHPSEYTRTRVVSFWLIHIRHAVRRLPGFPFVLCCLLGGRKNRSSLGFTDPTGVLLSFVPPVTNYRLAGEKSCSPTTLVSFSCSSALAAAENSIKGGAANSRRSPLLAFLRFQRAGHENRFRYLSSFFHPKNALELVPSGFSSFQRSEVVSNFDPPLPFSEYRS